MEGRESAPRAIRWLYIKSAFPLTVQRTGNPRLYVVTPIVATTSPENGHVFSKESRSIWQ